MANVSDTSSDARQQAAATLQRLVAGNARFAAGEVGPPTVDETTRQALVGGQEPIAVLLGCVDSRVPPEVVLDQGLGDLLAARTAGQALAGGALGSIEFGVRVLGIPLVVVLGHTGCGAVLAALGDDRPSGHLGALAAEVAERLTGASADDPDHATGVNLAAAVEALRALDGLTTPAGDRPFVVGLLYDLSTGLVTVTDDAGLG